jgi:hypothetical protein
MKQRIRFFIREGIISRGSAALFGVLIAGLFISCTLPSAVEVKAKPSVSLPVKSGTADLTDIFSDAIEESFSDGTVYECSQTENLTFLVYVEKSESTEGVSPSLVSRSAARGGALNETEDSDDPSIGDVLEDFEFSGVKAWLRIRAGQADILNEFKPELTVTYGESSSLLKNKKITIKEERIGISRFLDDNGKACKLTEYSSLLDFFTDGEDVSAEISALLNNRPEDLVFNYELKTSTPNITVGGTSYNFNTLKGTSSPQMELFIWVPLEFTAGAGGGTIKFPDMFDKDEDLFGRKDDDEDSMLDMIRSLWLNIELTEGIFSGGEMSISEKLSPYPLEGNSLKLDVSKGDMDIIKKTMPFAPDIEIKFKPGEELKIPKSLGATGISFLADIDYTIEL